MVFCAGWRFSDAKPVADAPRKLKYCTRLEIKAWIGGGTFLRRVLWAQKRALRGLEGAIDQGKAGDKRKHSATHAARNPDSQ